jgi:hypothetical protein
MWKHLSNKLIDEYGTYIKQCGQLSVTLHQTALTAFEHQHWAPSYQNSQTYEELEDKQLLEEAINEMGTVTCAN